MEPTRGGNLTGYFTYPKTFWRWYFTAKVKEFMTKVFTQRLCSRLSSTRLDLPACSPFFLTQHVDYCERGKNHPHYQWNMKWSNPKTIYYWHLILELPKVFVFFFLGVCELKLFLNNLSVISLKNCFRKINIHYSESWLSQKIRLSTRHNVSLSCMQQYSMYTMMSHLSVFKFKFSS